MLKSTEYLIDQFNKGNLDSFLLDHSVSDAVVKDLIAMFVELQDTAVSVTNIDQVAIECPCCHTKYTINFNDMNNDAIHCLNCGHEYYQICNIYQLIMGVHRFRTEEL